MSRGQKTLILEKNQVGGLIRRVSAVTHYAAIVEGETGESFAKRLRKQAENAGVEILKTEVKKVELTGVEKRIYTEKECYCAKKVILANGTSPRKLGIPGEIELAGRGIGMNAAKDFFSKFKTLSEADVK